MDANLILSDDDTELARARALVGMLWDSEAPADVARLRAQALLIAAYEESRWPTRPPSPAELIRHLMDQHGLSRADMVPYLGTPSRVSEAPSGGRPRPDDGAAATRALLRSGRLAAYST
jgi:HTH-type transcriptional regulator/antitoxin HigA